MTVNYTTNLALGQPVTGTESGTWGDDVNNAVTSYLDIAIAGGLSVAITTADVTLTLTQGDSSATNIGSTTAQYAILNITGAKTAARTLNVPASSRHYIINNSAATGGFLLTVRGVTPTTGITLVDGEKAIIAWNGTDYVKIVSTALSNSTGTLAATNGGTGQSSYAVGDVLYASTTTALSKLADVATGNALISGGVGVAPSYGKIGLTTHVSGILPIANGGTNSTDTPTNGGVTYGTGTAQAYSAAGTSGQVLISAGAAAPTWSSGTGTGLVVRDTSPTIATATLTGANTIQTMTVGLGGSAVSSNTVVGNLALNSNTTGSSNTAVGQQALSANTSGAYNTAVGWQAGSSGTMTGNFNIAVGASSLASTSSGSDNIAVGYGALNLNAGGSSNVAIGTSALAANTTGTGMVAIGHQALRLADTNSFTVAIGYQALAANTTAQYNVAVGYVAATAVTTGTQNTAIGWGTLVSATTVNDNTAIGFNVLPNATGASNTGVGSLALHDLSSGANNIGIGYNSGSAITTGSNNVVIGGYTGSAAPISATGSNWIVLSDGAGNVRGTLDSAGNFLVGTTSADTPATTSSLSVANTFGFKNRIINGAFNVLQYSGVGASGGTGNASAYTCDRWIAQASAGSPSFTAAVASTTLPTSSVPQNALTITQSASSGGALAIAQRIEAINVADLHNQTVAVQLYAATSTSATVTWTAYYANTANTWQAVGSSTSITTGATSIATGTFTTSTSIALKTFTFALGTNASTNGLMIVFSISAGVSVTFTITGVQLEKGAATTAFDYRPYTTELTLASRYFGQYGTIVSTVTNTNPIVPRTAMRTNPTVSAVSVPSGTGAVYTFSSYPSTSASIGFGAAYLSTAHSVTAQGFFTLNSEL